MTQPDLFPDPTPTIGDVCAGKHRGNPESVAAHESSPDGHAAQREAVFDHLRQCGAFGATSWEVHLALNIPFTAASARCSELKRDGRARPNGVKRRGQTKAFAAVLVACDMPQGRTRQER